MITRPLGVVPRLWISVRCNHLWEYLSWHQDSVSCDSYYAVAAHAAFKLIKPGTNPLKPIIVSSMGLLSADPS